MEDQLTNLEKDVHELAKDVRRFVIIHTGFMALVAIGQVVILVKLF